MFTFEEDLVTKSKNEIDTCTDMWQINDRIEKAWEVLSHAMKKRDALKIETGAA